ncbi:MAG TPA: hypothetical protein VN541_07705 [Tepidisphaeraceae bacterium]|nr:hypothetical protein [Tepidisphaeraceae bacterium]
MEVQPINYAPAVAFHQQRRVQRLVAAALVVVACAAFGARCGPAAWSRVKLLYWQGRAMRYTAPTDQKECVSVAAWLRFGELAAPPGPREQPVLFLHERFNSRGESRLVAVEGGRVNSTAGANGQALTVWATVFQPGGVFSSPVELSSKSSALEAGESPPGVRWVAGQPDQLDGSHFTICYECGGKQHVIDGWLHDNDTVTLEPRR